MIDPEGTGFYHLKDHTGRVNIRSAVRQPVVQYDESLDWIDREVGAGNERGEHVRFPSAIDEITQGTRERHDPYR